MAYLNCGRCGLRIRIQAAYLKMDNCPRCLARNATVVPMTLSSGAVTPAAGWGSRAPDRHSERRERTASALAARDRHGRPALP